MPSKNKIVLKKFNMKDLLNMTIYIFSFNAFHLSLSSFFEILLSGLKLTTQGSK